MVRIINGKEMAAKMRGQLKTEVEKLVKEKGVTPKLEVILVGDDPGSQLYVRNKERACREVGITSEAHRLPATTKQSELNGLIQRLNQDKKVNGILVQLPLPKGLDPIAALNVIDPAKDVDGIHPLNMGNLLRGEKPLFLPCTPLGIMEMVLSTGISLEGKEAVVVGRSNIVGKPSAVMLLQKNATVTVCHSKTRDLAGTVKRGDVVVAAVGTPELVRGEMIKEGAVVIDVGMNLVGDRWVGDVDYDGASKRAAYISPVPGGVGPMTIVMLLKNTVLSAERAGRSTK